MRSDVGLRKSSPSRSAADLLSSPATASLTSTGPIHSSAPSLRAFLEDGAKTSTMNSSSDVDDTATSAFSTTKKDARIFLTIPGKMILDEMLEQLGLPAAEYREKICEGHKTCVTIIFHTPKLSRQGSFIPMTISGVRSMDAVVAEHTAAIEVVRYLESAANTVVKDLNYSQMKQLQKENEYLQKKLKEANVRSEKLARGWFLAVRQMCSFSDQFHNIAILGYFGGQEDISDSMKAMFANIEGIAQRLKSISAHLETRLAKKRKSP